MSQRREVCMAQRTYLMYSPAGRVSQRREVCGSTVA